MVKSRIRYLLASAIAALAFLFATGASAQNLVEVHFAKATRTGPATCPAKYPAKGGQGAAFLHIFNNSCWSCPAGYNRTINPDVKAPTACEGGGVRHAHATRHARATGLLHTDCPRGSNQFWHVGDGFCYSCPRGYGRTIYGIHSAQACETHLPVRHAAGTYRGAPGCEKGSFQNGVTGDCFSCPPGYARSPIPNFKGDLQNDPRACIQVTAPLITATLTPQHRTAVDRVRKENTDLISHASKVAANLVDHVDDIRVATAAGKPLSPQLRQSTGLDALASEAADKGFQTISIGVAVDGSVGTGGVASAGLAHGTQNWTGVYSYSSVTWSVCCSLGLDVAPEIGFWKATPDKIAGNGHGVTFGASYGGGVALAFWWDYCPGVEGKICIFHPFLGFSVSPEIGESAEFEYMRGHTNSALIRVIK